MAVAAPFSDGVGDDSGLALRAAPERGLDRPCKQSDLHGPGRAGGLLGEYVLLDSSAEGEDWNARALFGVFEGSQAPFASLVVQVGRDEQQVHIPEQISGWRGFEDDRAVAGAPQQKRQGKPGHGVPTDDGYRDL